MRLVACLGVFVLGCEGLVVAPVAGMGVPGTPNPTLPGTPGTPPPGTPDPTLPAPSRLVCQPGQEPSAADVRRLGRVELTNTLYELFGRADFAPAQALAASLPADTFVGAYDSATASADAVQVSSIYDLVDALTTQLTVSDAAVSARFGSCFTTTATDACLTTFFSQWGLRLFRRPLSTEEKTRYTTVYRAAAASFDARTSLKALLMVMLQATPFLYHTEWNGTQTGDLLQLTGYEVASRLSYLVHGCGPDDALLAAAALPADQPGSLLTAEGLSAQFDRLVTLRRGFVPYDSTEKAFADATAFTFERFFDQWLDLANTPVFNYPDAYVNDSQYGYPIPLRADATLRTDALRELKKYLADAAWKHPTSYRGLMTSNQAFLGVSSALRMLYDPSLPAPPNEDTPVEIASGHRNGLLTHLPLLVSGLPKTAPFHRALTLLDRFACQPLSRPDPNSLPPGALNAPPDDPLSTTRQRFESKTSSSSCQSCHAQINPVGFAFEDFDGLGRHRTLERTFALDGTLAASLPIDSGSVVLLDGMMRPVTGGSDLGAVLADSTQAQECFVRQFFRFAAGREERTEDGCTLTAAAEALRRPDGTMRDMFKALVLAPDFRARRLVAPVNP